MKIGGYLKQSLIDYPGNISLVVFTQGCNFRCGYCHNPELVLREKFVEQVDEREIFSYISKYEKLLDAVCISGGEPTIHNDLPLFIKKLKTFNIKVKLDTNGSNPDMLKILIKHNLVDFISMDLKHIPDYNLYKKAAGEILSEDTFHKVLRSINILQNSGIDYELRTTLAKGLHNHSHINEILRFTKGKITFNNFRKDVTLAEDLSYEPFSEEEFTRITEACKMD